jgi:hypothetical protein
VERLAEQYAQAVAGAYSRRIPVHRSPPYAQGASAASGVQVN